jgi:metal-responsive CopG/Arc/MetJ family transcriptional regulator
MGNNFVVKPKSSDKKEDTHVFVSVRIEKELLSRYDRLAGQSGRSRNELICMALQYTMENLEFVSDESRR